MQQLCLHLWLHRMNLIYRWGSIHSLPVQLTYNGTLDDNGNLTSAREQSILYGTMEGGLHIVDASSGIEQMVFVPADILNDSVASKALVVGQ